MAACSAEMRASSVWGVVTSRRGAASTTRSAAAKLTPSLASRHCSAAHLGATQRGTLTVRSCGYASIWAGLGGFGWVHTGLLGAACGSRLRRPLAARGASGPPAPGARHGEQVAARQQLDEVVRAAQHRGGRVERQQLRRALQQPPQVQPGQDAAQHRQPDLGAVRHVTQQQARVAAHHGGDVGPDAAEAQQRRAQRRQAVRQLLRGWGRRWHGSGARPLRG